MVCVQMTMIMFEFVRVNVMIDERHLELIVVILHKLNVKEPQVVHGILQTNIVTKVDHRSLMIV